MMILTSKSHTEMRYAFGPVAATFLTASSQRVIMTRTDYMVDLDVQNVIKIDASHMIRPDSRL